jgi:hypothetical protein
VNDRTHVFDFIFPPNALMPYFISQNHVLNIQRFWKIADDHNKARIVECVAKASS